MTAVVYVEITSAHINGNVVIAVTCNSSQSCVLVEAVTACCVRDQREKALCAEIVYPRIRGLGRCNDILLVLIVKITEFHRILLMFLFL